MNSELMRYIDRSFAKISRRMRNIVARGVVSMVQDGTKMQENQIKLLDGEVIEKTERPQQYGFSSHPHPGAECFVVFTGADRGHGLILAVDDRRYRVQATKPGEVVIYTDEGDQIALKRENTIEVTTKHFIVKAEDDVLFQTKEFTVEADATAFRTNGLAFSNKDGEEVEAMFQGGINATEDVKANAGQVSLAGHTHKGVQSGDETTGKPVGGR